MLKIVPKSVQTCFEHVLGQFFRKVFLPSLPWRVESSKIFKKIKKFSKFQKCIKLFPKVSKRVLNMFWGNFSKIFFAQSSMEGRVFENFQKNQKIFKIPKMLKIVPKSFQTCFEHILGQFFRKFFLPSLPWRVESSKIFKKIKKFSKFQKCIKLFPKVSKRVLNMFWGNFSKIFFAQSSMEGRVFENFQKNQKIFKNPKMLKIVPKSFQTCFEHVLGQFFRKVFLPSLPWRVESSKIFKKIKKFSKIQKCSKSFPKVSKRVLNMFWGNFSVKFFAHCSIEGRVYSFS